MDLPLILLLGIIVLFAILGLPRFVRAAYLSWFNVERFREVETKRIEQLWADRPKSLADNTDAWRTRVQSEGWLWYNRIVVTVALLVLIGFAIILLIGLLGIGPVTTLI